jgi:hypothetical protein
MHTNFLYFNYSTKVWQEVLQQSYKLDPPTKDVKAPPTPGKIQRNCLVRKLQRSPPPLYLRTHLQGVRTKQSLSPNLPLMSPQCQTEPPSYKHNTTHILHRDSMAPWRRESMSSMQEGARRSTSEPPISIAYSKNDAHTGERHRALP